MATVFTLSATLGHPAQPPDTGAAGWLPGDGYRQRLAGPEGTVAIEWARGQAATMIGSGPEPFGTWLGLTELDWETVQLARLTSVSLDPSGRATGRRDDLWSVEVGGLRTEAEAVSDGSSRVYVPGRLDVPDALAPGRSWTSEGAVLQQLPQGEATPLPYRADYTAVAPEDPELAGGGCVTIRRTEQIGDQQQAPAESTWCPGRGPVALAAADGSWRRIEQDPVAPVAADPGFDWSRAADLEFEPRTVNQLGVGNTLVSPVAAPALLADGTVVFANHISPDVIALDTTAEPPPSVWRARPGRRISTSATLGDTTVVATTDRQVVAYGPAGDWRWQAPLSDLAQVEPVRFGELVVLATLDGAITAYDLATGAERWRTEVAAEVRVRLVVAADRLLVVDQAGALSCLDPAGQVVWNVDVGRVEHFGVSAGPDPVVVVPLSDRPRVVGVRLADGEQLWRSRQDVTALDVLTLEGGVVLRDEDELVTLDPATGARAWTWRGARTFAGAGGGDRLLVLTIDRLLLLDGGGRQLKEWPVAVGDVSSAEPYLVGTQGRVLLYGPTGMVLGEPR